MSLQDRMADAVRAVAKSPRCAATKPMSKSEAGADFEITSVFFNLDNMF